MHAASLIQKHVTIIVHSFFSFSTVGDRAFPVAAARVWNSLPASVTSSPSLSTFKRNLKTELFARSYLAR